MTTTSLHKATATAYLRMAREANYRPVYIDPPEVDDLTPEARNYAEHFLAEEDACIFHIGCPDYRHRDAFVFTIEAARLLCGADSGSFYAAMDLLDMARAELEALMIPRRTVAESAAPVVVACTSCGQPNPGRYRAGGLHRCPECRAAGLA